MGCISAIERSSLRLLQIHPPLRPARPCACPCARGGGPPYSAAPLAQYGPMHTPSSYPWPGAPASSRPPTRTRRRTMSSGWRSKVGGHPRTAQPAGVLDGGAGGCVASHPCERKSFGGPSLAPRLRLADFPGPGLPSRGPHQPSGWSKESHGHPRIPLSGLRLPQGTDLRPVLCTVTRRAVPSRALQDPLSSPAPRS